MSDKIIEVTVDKGRIDYRLWPCGLDTRGYGSVFADLVQQVARMISEQGGYNRDEIAEDIVKAFNDEIKKPMNTMVGLGQLQ